jgi:hypothetical protein
MTRVLVTGGRDYSDKATLRRAILEARPSLLISGGARGADRLAAEIADDLGIPQMIFPANWTGEGRAAGVIRNQRMLDLRLPASFWPLRCVGTADMVERARRDEHSGSARRGRAIALVGRFRRPDLSGTGLVDTPWT